MPRNLGARLLSRGTVLGVIYHTIRRPLTMTKFITARVLVERLIEEHGSLFIEAENLVRFMAQLAACDHETVILEYEKRQLEAVNRNLWRQVQQLRAEIYRLETSVCR